MVAMKRNFIDIDKEFEEFLQKTGQTYSIELERDFRKRREAILANKAAHDLAALPISKTQVAEWKIRGIDLSAELREALDAYVASLKTSKAATSTAAKAFVTKISGLSADATAKLVTHLAGTDSEEVLTSRDEMTTQFKTLATRPEPSAVDRAVELEESADYYRNVSFMTDKGVGMSQAAANTAAMEWNASRRPERQVRLGALFKALYIMNQMDSRAALDVTTSYAGMSPYLQVLALGQKDALRLGMRK